MTKLIALLAFVLALAGPAGAAEVGVYHGASSAYGNHLSSLPPEVSVAHVSIWGEGFEEHRLVVDQAASRGLRLVYQVHDVAFVRSGNVFTLRPDWRERSVAVEEKVRILRDEGVLHSVYLADEPYSHGITFEALSVVNAFWRGRGYETMVVEVYGLARAARPAYSYFGFTPYYLDRGTWRTIGPEKWARILEASRANVLVVQSFNTLRGEIPDQSAQEAMANGRTVLILRFLWPTIPALNLRGLDSHYGPPPPITFRCPFGRICACEGCGAR